MFGFGHSLLKDDASRNWTPQLTPSFALPDTGLSLVVGDEVTIYGDELIAIPIDNDLDVTYTCDIGSQTGNNYTISPITANIGDHSLAMIIKDGSHVIETKTITLTVRAKVVDGSLDLLMIGDSTLAGVITAETIETSLSGVNVTFIGTQGTTKKHEARSGWTWRNFATSYAVTSPFFKAGVLDVPAYFTDNSIAVPEIVYFRLGVNDVFNYSASDITDANITTILGYADTLINAFLAYNAKLRIIIAIPTTAANVVTGWNADYDESTYNQDKFIEILQKYRKALITKYAGGVYNARVDCSYEATQVDRNTGYANGLHPSAGGYGQLGTGLASYISKLMNEMFGANLIPQDSSHLATDGTAWWSAGVSITKSYNAGGYMNMAGTKGAWGTIFSKGVLCTVGKNYKWSIKAKSSDYTGKLALNLGTGAATPSTTPNLTSSWVVTKGTCAPASNGNFIILNAAAIAGSIDFDDVMIQEIL